MLTKTQTEILKGIQKRLIRGDIGFIASAVGKSRVYVSRVLNPSIDVYNKDIVFNAVELIGKREQDNEKLLKKLQAA